MACRILSRAHFPFEHGRGESLDLPPVVLPVPHQYRLLVDPVVRI